ncbi:hypothetical protein C8Q77DRAFT_448714 [Trametes polyzona]|nr:hypothetical protein C8Q77DRAFT_448714 [Trametes polyzona]
MSSCTTSPMPETVPHILTALVGGSVGGAVAVLVAVAFAIYIFLKRRISASTTAPFQEPVRMRPLRRVTGVRAFFVGHRPWLHPDTAASSVHSAPTLSFLGGDTSTGLGFATPASNYKPSHRGENSSSPLIATSQHSGTSRPGEAPKPSSLVSPYDGLEGSPPPNAPR